MTAGIRKILITALTVTIPVTASAHFEDIGVGARAIGMGGAYTAIAEDAYAMYYNPACLGGVKWKDMGMNYEKLHWGLGDSSSIGGGYAGYAQEIKSIGKRKIGGTAGFGWLNFSLSRFYSNNTIILGYGREIVYKIKNEEDPGWIKKILNHFGEGRMSAGLNLKILRKGYGSTEYTENAVDLDTGQHYGGRDPVFKNGYSRTGFSIDVGFLYKLNDWNRFALVIKDINSPNMGMMEKDKVSRRLKIGYGYIGREINTAVDMTMGGGDIRLHGGAEKWFLGQMVAVRSGLGIGSREYAALTLGGSYRHNKIYYLDYSFRYPLRGVRGVAGSHQISISIKLGAPEPGTGKGAMELRKKIQLARKDLIREKKKAEEAIEEAAKIKEEAEKKIQEAKKLQLETEKMLMGSKATKTVVKVKKVEKKEEIIEKQVEETELKSMVLFDSSDWELKPSGKRTVDNIAETLIVFPLQKLKVEGHADLSEDNPVEIATKRAEAIIDYLVSEFQIDKDRMVIESYAAEKPIGDPTTEDGRAKNKRVEMSFIE
ncbi:OmpA family protein [Elusimicrobiota bacterium]